MKKQTWLVLLLVLAMVMTAGLLQACTPEVPETFTITFMADGIVVSTLTVNEGEAVTFPAVPAKEGYTGVWNPTSIAAASADATVNAVYTAIAATTYDVTFVADGTTVSTLTVEEGEAVAASAFPTVPAKEGYVGVWNVTSIAAVTANTTVTAVYTKIHTITFVADGTVLDTIEVLDGEAVPAFPAVPAKTGYTGVWNPTAIDELTGDVTVTAVYTAINFVTLAFDTDGGDEMEAVQLELGAVPGTPATPVKAGYTFDGWYADAALNNLYNFGTALTADTTVYASWTINEYTVTIPTAYQNTINYVAFSDLDVTGATNYMFYTTDGGATYECIASGDTVPYGAKVYFKVATDAVGTAANKT
ncbi:MAG TPA: InlB B-repeat-containing protein, partial [Clostridia bacterium]|nr:InlB B-repeat-containing protein [Clostridia bacterium]